MTRWGLVQFDTLVDTAPQIGVFLFVGLDYLEVIFGYERLFNQFGDTAFCSAVGEPDSGGTLSGGHVGDSTFKDVPYSRCLEEVQGSGWS